MATEVITNEGSLLLNREYSSQCKLGFLGLKLYSATNISAAVARTLTGASTELGSELITSGETYVKPQEVFPIQMYSNTSELPENAVVNESGIEMDFFIEGSEDRESMEIGTLALYAALYRYWEHFDMSKAYDVGDHVYSDSIYYVCILSYAARNQADQIAPVNDATHWQSCTIVEGFELDDGLVRFSDDEPTLICLLSHKFAFKMQSGINITWKVRMFLSSNNIDGVDCQYNSADLSANSQVQLGYLKDMTDNNLLLRDYARKLAAIEE